MPRLTDERKQKMRIALHLLQPAPHASHPQSAPGPEVVTECLDEIDALTLELAAAEAAGRKS
jgi:hypothetical protein